MIFGHQLNDDYLALATEAALPPAKTIQLARHGVVVADLPAATKQHYYAELDAALKAAPSVTA